MRKAAIYARYSTDLQNENSIADQIALCRKFADRERILISEVYEDRAISGATIVGRPGLLGLLSSANKGRFQVLIAESLDRISRDIADLSQIHKTLSFLGIDIVGVNDGGNPADTVLIGLRGLVAQLFREDGAKKVKRGMVGLVSAGKHAGGRAYGYRPNKEERGAPVIVDSEAIIVRRIFSEYLAGKSPREIAHQLNVDGTSPPRGNAWNASTINGSRQRGNGIIQNDLYAGKIVWNKVRMVKHPVTGRRISRPNARSEWIECERPDLAIIESDIFDRANALKREKGNTRPEHSMRNVRLFSGLLKCGCCGGGLGTAGMDKSKRVRVRCSRHAESGTCPDPRTYYLQWIESTVLGALGAELRERKAITEAETLYQNGLDAHREAARRRYSEAVARLNEIGAELDRLTDLLARGIGDPMRIDQRCQQGRMEECALRAELQDLDDAEDDLEIHSATVTDYLKTVRGLRASAKKGTVAPDSPAAVRLRMLVKSVILVPALAQGVPTVEITGRLRPLCRRRQRAASSGEAMVAGEGLALSA